jgi:hypothetical protein
MYAILASALSILNLLEFYKNNYDESLKYTKWYPMLTYGLNVLANMTGTIYPLFKLSEPYFLRGIGRQISKMTCRKNNKNFNSLTTSNRKSTFAIAAKESRTVEDPNIVFLSSAMNNLLVSGILKGINISMIQ